MIKNETPDSRLYKASCPEPFSVRALQLSHAVRKIQKRTSGHFRNIIV